MGSSSSVANSKTSLYRPLRTISQTAVTHVILVGVYGTTQQYAMKRIKKPGDDLPGGGAALWTHEVGILKQLTHPRILEYIDSFEDSKGWNIVTGYLSGGELFERVVNLGKFSERSAARMVRQMVTAVAYCHSHSIVHRDLKPENFVFEHSGEDSPLRLIDFGNALKVADDEIVLDAVGSPYYIAPYLLQQEWRDKRNGLVWKACDMWSIGVIIYVLVVGYAPFNGNSQKEIFEKIRKCSFKFPAAKAGETPLSDEVRDLITRLITTDLSKQLTAANALEHPWLSGKASDAPLPDHVLPSIVNFSKMSKLRRVVARVLKNEIIESDKGALTQIFQQYDANGDGKLSVDEVVTMMKSVGKSEIDAKDMMDVFDSNHDGEIAKEEFTTGAALQKLGNQSREEMEKTFKQFDLNGDGFVTAAEIEKLYSIDKESLKQIIEEVDTNHDGKISLDEWIAAMKGMPLKSLRQQ